MEGRSGKPTYRRGDEEAIGGVSEQKGGGVSNRKRTGLRTKRNDAVFTDVEAQTIYPKSPGSPSMKPAESGDRREAKGFELHSLLQEPKNAGPLGKKSPR